jgi:hypothetical protein
MMIVTVLPVLQPKAMYYFLRKQINKNEISFVEQYNIYEQELWLL